LILFRRLERVSFKRHFLPLLSVPFGVLSWMPVDGSSTVFCVYDRCPLCASLSSRSCGLDVFSGAGEFGAAFVHSLRPQSNLFLPTGTSVFPQCPISLRSWWGCLLVLNVSNIEFLCRKALFW